MVLLTAISVILFTHMPLDAYKMYHMTAATKQLIKQPRPNLHPGPRELNSPTLPTGTGWGPGRAPLVLCGSNAVASSSRDAQEGGSRPQTHAHWRFLRPISCRSGVGGDSQQVVLGTRAHTVPQLGRNQPPTECHCTQWVSAPKATAPSFGKRSPQH